MSKKNETTQIQTLVEGIASDRPEWLEEGNAGSENVTTNDMILPRIDIIQAISPQLKNRDPAYIEGAKQGDIFNTVTGEIYGSELQFVPVMFRKEWVIWKIREFGGGIVDVFPDQRSAQDACSKLPNITQQNSKGQMVEAFEIVETHQHFVILLTAKGMQEAVFSMTKSKMKVSRALNTLVQISNADRFAKAYKVTTAEDKSDKGEYWTFKVHPVGWVSKELYDIGKKLYEKVKTGAADVDRTTGTETSSESQRNTYDSDELG